MWSRFDRTYAPLWPSPVARVATVAMLVFYPAGAVLRLVQPDSTLDVVGLLLIGAAGIIAAAFTATYAYQLTQAKEERLDERERQVRHRAHTIAYGGIAAALLLGTIYSQLSFDFGWWMPSTRDHWRAVFWGLVILVLTLPSVCLVWTDAGRSDEAE